MGRRKIEIKPIRDDRNRSVTFLKRKGGLFKKAHELSVLCSVDVAVIIFGHNKKLYEYSSSDIGEIINRHHYYGNAHEHKGPQDFADKRGGDDDDDDDEAGDEADERGTPQPDYGRINPPMQNHPGFQHVRQGTPSGSPPMHNGAMPQFQRGPSPLPQGMSRPSSRAAQHPQHPQHVRRTSANLNPPHSGPPPQPNYAYTPNPPFYNPQAAAAAQMQQRQPPPPVSHPAASYPPPYPAQPAVHPQMHQAYMQDTRRSMPPGPAYTPPQANMNRHPSQDHLQPPQPAAQPHGSPRPRQQPRPTPSPQPPPQQFTSPPIPQPKPLPATAKSSIFTPIDDSRSLLAQHWGSTNNAEANPRSSAGIKPEPDASGGPRSQSIDVAAMQRERDERLNGSTTPSPPHRPSAARTPQLAQRTASTPTLGPPSRSSTNQSEPKRPRLKVQIPSEQSGDEGGGGSAPDSTSQAGNTGVHPPSQPSHGVVLPPPSPSAGALMSAGAQGPPNPFARPPPPNPHAASRDPNSNSNNNNNNNNNHIETPISALPSRFMGDLLPSPSTFYPEWSFGRGGDNNMLPSPLNFTTPIAPNGSGWRDEDRKRSGEELEGGEAKKAKT